MMQYIENVAKKTYEAFAIRQHNPPPRKEGQDRAKAVRAHPTKP